MASHPVARVGEIPPGGRKIVEIGGRSIGVFNVDGEFFALRNRCPHQGGPLCEGQVLAAIAGDGSRRVRARAPRRHRALPVARVGVQHPHGAVVVRPGAHPGARPIPVEVEHAETFPVSVEDDYVVVEL